MNTEYFVDSTIINNKFQEEDLLEHPFITLHILFQHIIDNINDLNNDNTYINFINNYKETLYLESEEIFSNNNNVKKLLILRENIAKKLFSNFINFPQYHTHIKDNILITYQDWITEEDNIKFNSLLDSEHINILSQYQHIPGYSEYISKLFSLDKNTSYKSHLELLLNKSIDWDILFTNNNPFLGKDLIDFFKKERTFTRDPHIIHALNNFIAIWNYTKLDINNSGNDI